MRPGAYGVSSQRGAHDRSRGSLSDIPAWTKDTGNSLKEQFEENDEFHFIIEKA